MCMVQRYNLFFYYLSSPPKKKGHRGHRPFCLAAGSQTLLSCCAYIIGILCILGLLCILGEARLIPLWGRSETKRPVVAVGVSTTMVRVYAAYTVVIQRVM